MTRVLGSFGSSDQLRRLARGMPGLGTPTPGSLRKVPPDKGGLPRTVEDHVLWTFTPAGPRWSEESVVPGRVVIPKGSVLDPTRWAPRLGLLFD